MVLHVNFETARTDLLRFPRAMGSYSRDVCVVFTVVVVRFVLSMQLESSAFVHTFRSIVSPPMNFPVLLSTNRARRAVALCTRYLFDYRETARKKSVHNVSR